MKTRRFRGFETRDSLLRWRKKAAPGAVSALRRRLLLEHLQSRELLDGHGVLGGAVFQDLDRDGQWDAGEPPLEGWTIEFEKAESSDSPLRVSSNPTPDEWSQFGRFVATVGEDILVSSHYDEIAGPASAGAVYQFQGQSGELRRTFISPTPDEDDRFGRALAGVGGNVLIGAPLDDSAAVDSGAAYLFDGLSGELLHTFLSPAAGENDQFGRAVAAVGDKVLIGARLDDRAGEDAGAAYLFDSVTGELLQTFVSSTPSDNAQFGYSVAALGDDVLIGARYDETGANGIGVVYLFDGDTGRLLRRFSNPTQRGNGEASGFGRAVAAVGENVLVGARWDDTGADGAGSAFLFDGASGALLHTFTSPTPFYREEFGMSVASAGKDILVGARWDNRWDNLGQNSGGAVYRFDGDTGELMQVLANPAPGAWDAFGISVAALGEQVVVGTQSGNAAYIFNAAATSQRMATDAAGQFQFDNLEAGAYRVRLVGRDGYAATSGDGAGSYLIAIEDDEERTNLNFGQAANQSPLAGNDDYAMTEDDSLTVPADAGLLQNDLDADGDPITALVASQPARGTLQLAADGSFHYQPDADFFGTDQFTYRVSDGVSRSQLATVSIVVAAKNDRPVATNNGLWLPANTAREISSPGLLADDLDVDGDSIAAQLVDPPQYGAVDLRQDGSYSYTPLADYTGPDHFTYRASDGQSVSEPATVQIMVSVNSFDSLGRYLRISEVNYYPYALTAQERAMGYNDRELFEFVELTNTGSAPLDLWGVRLSEAVDFSFLESQLIDPGEHVVLVRDREAFAARNGTGPRIVGEYRGDLHNSGEAMALRDPFEQTIASFTYDDGGDWTPWADGFGSTLELSRINDSADNDSADNGKNWRASTEYGGSPGAAGQGKRDSVVINEVLTHSNLPLTDAVELHNTTSREIDVSGWYLSESANDLKKFRIPAGTVIPAGGYVVFDEYDFNPGRWEPGAGGFAFDSADGDDVWLTAADPEGNLTFFADHLEFDAALRDESYGRWPNGEGSLYPMQSLTLGGPNSGPRLGALMVSEIMYHPANGEAKNLAYVEVFNASTETVDLRNWQIRGDISYDFPLSYSGDPVPIAPGETVLVAPFSPQDAGQLAAFGDFYSLSESPRVFGPWNRTLPSSGGTIDLLRPDAPPWWEPHSIPRVLVESVVYDVEDPWPATADGGGESLHRRDFTLWGKDATGWTAAAPTPGQVNLQVGDLAISEINYHPYTPTPAELELNPQWSEDDFEFIELLNVSGSQIDLAGMRFTFGVAFDFPNTQLAAGQRGLIVRNAEAIRARYGESARILGQYAGTLSNGGERLTLRDAADQVLLSFAYDDNDSWPQRADGEGSSLELTDILGNYGSGSNWRASISYGGSPGAVDQEPIQQVVINEVLVDASDHANDRLELYNTTGGAVDVGGWYLTNNGGDPLRFRFPPDSHIPAYGYLVLPGDDFIFPAESPGFVLDPFRENRLFLLQPDALGNAALFVDETRFGAGMAGESWGRWPDSQGEMYPMLFPTLDPVSGGNSGPRVGPLIISEVMYHPRTTGELIAQDDLEFVEVFNPTDQTIQLDGWRLEGGVEFQFPGDASLASREALIIVPFDLADANLLDAFREHYALRPWVDIVGGFSGSLSNRGEQVRLFYPGEAAPDEPDDAPLILADVAHFDDTAPWPATADGFGFSLQRDGADSWGAAASGWLAALPTIGFVEAPLKSIAISEVNYHPHSPTTAELATDPTLSSEDFEFVELLNISGVELRLGGWRLGGGIDVVLPDVTLNPGSRLLAARNPAALALRHGALGAAVVGPYNGALSDTGDVITLADAAGQELLNFAFGGSSAWPDRADGHGSSLEIVDLGGYYNDPDNWRASGGYGGSPGQAGQAMRQLVVINEVLPKTDNPEQDLIELYNNTTEPVDVGGWYLSNDWTDYRQFRIPDGTVLPGQGFAVFSGEDFFAGPGMDLSGQGDRIFLLESAENNQFFFSDDVQFGVAVTGKTYGRYPDGHGELMALVAPTLDPLAPQQGANSPASNAGSLIISEINYHPLPSLVDEPVQLPDSQFEFVELHNASDWPIALAGLRFDAGIFFDFAEMGPAELGPGEYLVVARNPEAFAVRYGAAANVTGPFSGGLSNGGESIRLSTDEDQVLFEFEYDDEDGWSTWADGSGATLELIDLTQAPPPGPQRNEYLANPNNWRASGRFLGSPGSPGGAANGAVVINEILADLNEPYVIELHNTSADPVDLTGWTVSDANLPGEDFEIPAGTAIPADGYLVLQDIPGGLFSYSGAELRLLQPDENTGRPWIVDGVTYVATWPGESLARWPDGEGALVPSRQPTLGDANAPPRVGPVIISEVHYHPQQEAGEDDLEFIELYNPTDQTIQLHNWFISGGVDIRFSSDDLIPPGGTAIVVPFDPDLPGQADRLINFLLTYNLDLAEVNLVGQYGGKLSNGGEAFRLMNYDLRSAVLEDEVAYDDHAPWSLLADGRGLSLQRHRLDAWGNDADSWIAAPPTPGVVANLTVDAAPYVVAVRLNNGLPDPADLPSGPQPSSWQLQRSEIRRITVTFSEPISLNGDNLRLLNLGLNAPLDADTQVSVTPDQLRLLGNVLTIDFAAQPLGDGVYQLDILPGVTDAAGENLDGNRDGVGGDAFHLLGNAENRFYQLTADFNGDGGASIFDFPNFAYWFGQSTAPAGLAPEYVDLNNDLGVSIFDFPVFAFTFNRRAVFPAAMQAAAGDLNAAPAVLDAPEKNALARASFERSANRAVDNQFASARDNDAALLELLAQWQAPLAGPIDAAIRAVARNHDVPPLKFGSIPEEIWQDPV